MYKGRTIVINGSVHQTTNTMYNTKTFSQQEKDNWIKIGLDHQKADRFLQGQWVTERDEEGLFKGCFFGCFMQTEENPLNKAVEVMKLPHWLVYVAERIFEGLPSEDSLEFPVRLLEAIPVDTDLTSKWKEWNYRLLMDETMGQINFGDKEVILKVADLFKPFDNSIIEPSAARLAEVATWSAKLLESPWSITSSTSSIIWSAASTARFAAKSAERLAIGLSDLAALSSASAVSSASSTAGLVAWSTAASERLAELTAELEARLSHYVWMRDLLIEILKK